MGRGVNLEFSRVLRNNLYLLQKGCTLLSRVGLVLVWRSEYQMQLSLTKNPCPNSNCQIAKLGKEKATIAGGFSVTRTGIEPVT